MKPLSPGDILCVDLRSKGKLRKATKRTKGPVVGVLMSEVSSDGDGLVALTGRGTEHRYMRRGGLVKVKL